MLSFLRQSALLISGVALAALAAPASFASTSSGIDTPAGIRTLPLAVQGNAIITITDNPANLVTINGQISSNGEISSTLTNVANLRMIGGSFGAIWRNDGANTYFLLTNDGDPYGSWNNLRPLYVDDKTGEVHINQGLVFADGSKQTTAPSASVTNVKTNQCVKHWDTVASCPAGSVLTGCGYLMTNWYGGGYIHSPDYVYPDDSNNCHMAIAGDFCAEVVATCLKN